MQYTAEELHPNLNFLERPSFSEETAQEEHNWMCGVLRRPCANGKLAGGGCDGAACARHGGPCSMGEQMMCLMT